MHAFPEFMRNPANAIAEDSQSPGIEGYVFDGADSSQMVFWQCLRSGVSRAHTHEYDEYFIVVEGEYTLILGKEKIPVRAGQEYFIPRGLEHAGEFVSGTRTIHAFGGRRARRKS